MKKIGLSVYSMHIAYGGTENRDLNNLVENKSFLEIFLDYIEENSAEYYNDVKQESIFLFCEREKKDICDENGKLNYQILSGRVKTGEYGIRSELVNIYTKDIYNRTMEQADVMPFGFSIIVPAGKVDTCIVVFQSFSQYGIKLLMHSKMEEAVRRRDSNLFVKLGSVMPIQYVRRFFEDGILQKISLIRYDIPADVSENYGINYGVESTYEERVIHKPVGFLTRRKKEIEEWMRGQRVSTEIVEIDGYKYNQMKLVFKLGKNEKTIDLDNLDRIVITEDITEKVQIVDGYPEFDSLASIMEETGKDYLKGQGLISG